MRVNLDNGNAIIENDGVEFKVTVPSKKNIFVILFVLAWLGGWAMGEFMVIGIVLDGGANPFLLFWLAGWTIGGGFAIFVLSWMLFGKEVVHSDGSYLSIDKCILVFRLNKEYELSHIKNIRIVERDTGLFRQRSVMEFYGLKGGIIHFDYGMKTVQFAFNIDVAEGNHLLNTVFRRIGN